MDRRRVTWIPFSPHDSYNRRYVDHLYATHWNQIAGDILDVGSGGDQSGRWMALSDDIERYVALDIAHEPGLDVRGDAAHLPFPDGSFDTVVTSEVLEHIPTADLPTVVGELSRVLRPGGTVLASTPFVYPQHGPPDHQRLTCEATSRLFEDTGFRTTVYTGGSYGETLLGILYRPIGGLLPKVGGTTLGWLFAPVHYATALLAAVLHRLALTAAGRNPRADIWYLMTFTVAEKPTEERT